MAATKSIGFLALTITYAALTVMHCMPHNSKCLKRTLLLSCDCSGSKRLIVLILLMACCMLLVYVALKLIPFSATWEYHIHTLRLLLLLLLLECLQCQIKRATALCSTTKDLCKYRYTNINIYIYTTHVKQKQCHTFCFLRRKLIYLCHSLAGAKNAINLTNLLDRSMHQCVSERTLAQLY